MILEKKEIGWNEEFSPDSPDLPVFIIQKHLNGERCYDFWLEIEGSLMLWKIEEGPLPETEKAAFLEMQAYYSLEPFSWEEVWFDDGTVIGPEIVWDAGEYRFLGNGDEKFEAALERGQVQVWLGGERLRGEYMLHRTNAEVGRPGWTLTKLSHKDRSL